MKNDKPVFSRHAIISLLLAFMVVVIIIRLISLQLIKGEEYYERIHDVLVRNIESEGERGQILDAKGNLLAYNERSYDVVVYYRRKTNDELNKGLLMLYGILNDSGETVLTELPLYLMIDPPGYGPRLSSDELINEWLRDMVEKPEDINGLNDTQDVFEYFKEKKFKIADKYSDLEAYKIMCLRYDMLIKGYTQLSPFVAAKNISTETMAKVELARNDIRGVYTQERFTRRYIDSKAFSHLTGYIRSIEQEEVEFYLSQGYGLNEAVGKEGLEKSYEKFLRPIMGTKTAVLEPGEIELEFDVSVEAVAGFDLKTSIHSAIQEAGYRSLEENIKKIAAAKDGVVNFGDTKYGSAVMLDVRTGDVIALVSYPGYDANIFISDDQDAIGHVIGSDDMIQLNRAIQGLYPPGSAFKPLTAIAAIESGVYMPGQKVTDEGVIKIDGMDFYGLEYKRYGISLGDIDLEYAMRVSANVFFYKTGMAAGIDNLELWARRFGLGEISGIDIGGEAQGRRNSKETIKQVEPERTWGAADTAQASIGQLYNQFTPLQLARYVMAIANGGKLYNPGIVSGIYKRDGSEVMVFENEYTQIEISPITLREVQKGMYAVANYPGGSAEPVFRDFPYGDIGAKTGTPETGREDTGESSHSVFICYAPFDDPEVAISVIIENGVWGENAALVAYDMLFEYFYQKGRTN